MPRHSPNLVRWSPAGEDYEVQAGGDPETRAPTPGSAAWFEWLDGIASFSFRGQSGAHCTVRKERLRRGGAYWYAYRSSNGRTIKRYIGRTADLSIARLEGIADRIDGLALALPGQGAGSLDGPAPEGIDRPESGADFADSEDVAPATAATHQPAAPPSAPSVPHRVGPVMPLLASKLHPPRLHGGLIERERLLDRLDAGLSRKLTVLSAPAGFGKTTLVRQWLAERVAHAGLPVAWVSLDAGDNDPVRFWRYVIAACQELNAGVGQSALAWLSAAVQPPFEPLPLETVLTFFLNDVTQHAHGGLLVLEDYHAIAAPRIHETLAFFIDHLPPTLHVVILARNEPPLPLLRWRARGDLHELQAGDLRFLPRETAAFFQQTLPFALSEKTMEQLDERLEGWAAGLRLLALTVQGPLTAREVERHVAILDAASGPIQPHHPIVDYFVSEVLHVQPEPLQLFLLRTSVLSRLTGPLCDVVTSRHDSAALLDAMERAGLFLESLDDTGQWYRYHALFAEAMRAVARQRLGEETLRALSLQASHWYEQHELVTEAVDAALHARDTERATILIESLAELDYFQFHELHTLRCWLEQMPDELRPTHPDLCLACAIALLFTQHPDPPTPALMARIDELLQMADDGWRNTGDQAKRGEVYAFRAMLAWREGRVREAARDARQALVWLPDDEDGQAIAGGPGVRGVLEWRAINIAILAHEELEAGHVEAARRLFQEAQRRCVAVGNRPFARVATLLLGSACVAMGELRQAEAYYRQVLPEAREQGDTDDVIFTLLSLIELAYEWNDLDAAEQMLGEIGEMGVPPDFPEIGELTACRWALLQHARGHTTAALQQIAGVLARLQARASPRDLLSMPNVLIWQGRLQIATGDLFGVQRSLDALSSMEGSMSPVQREMRQILAARLLLAQGQIQGALLLLDPLLSTAQKQRQIRQALEIQVLVALALAADRRAHEARQRLRLALSQACAEGFVRLFLDEGEPVAALLRSLLPSLRESALRSYARTVLQSFKPAQARRVVPAASSDGLPVEPLSAQEQRVLRLVAAGRSNAEIARELVVSVNTVKGHLKNLYRKLNVGNRLEATEAARRLPRV